jgi:hypothetical protein
MRHRKPKALHLNDDAIKQVWASNRGAIVDGTMGLALMYGKRRPRLTVILLLADDDSPKQRREKQRRIRTEGLVLLGHTHAVTETTVYRKNGNREFFPHPPVGYVFLIRHRLGPHNQFYATTYDGIAATQVPIRHAK